MLINRCCIGVVVLMLVKVMRDEIQNKMDDFTFSWLQNVTKTSRWVWEWRTPMSEEMKKKTYEISGFSRREMDRFKKQLKKNNSAT